MNNRKQQVLLIAQKLFVEKGFSSTSVQDILDESRISKGTFYNYFSSKTECLMAILEYAREESAIRRRELLIGQDITDKGILTKQILIRLQVNRERNLMPIFEAIFHSGDPDLRAFVKKHHLFELSWLTGRLIDVYGEDLTPYALDCAVMMLGITQHMIHTWTASSKEEIDSVKLINFAVRRLDSIVPTMIETKDVLLGERIFFNSADFLEEKTPTKQQVLTQLSDFHFALEKELKPKEKQYIQFLTNELQSEHPRIFILETIIRSFKEAFIGISYEPEARELAANIWRYVDTIEKDE